MDKRRFFVGIYRMGPGAGKRPEDDNVWYGTRIGALKPADAVRAGIGAYEFLPGELEVEISERLDPEAIWCLYDRPDSELPLAYSRVGRWLEPGDLFTIPLEPGSVGNLVSED